MRRTRSVLSVALALCKDVTLPSGSMGAGTTDKTGWTAEVPHSYFEVEGVAHNKKKLYESRKHTWFDFHVESLKLNGVELHYVKGMP